MKYFTRDLIERYGSSDEAVARKAEAEWEAANERYEQHLQALAPRFPAPLRAFQELLLHDAVVTSLARRGDQFIMVLLKDIPPRELVTLTYSLVAEPRLIRPNGPVEPRPPVLDFQCDEFDLVDDGGQLAFEQTILFGNGWELTLRFRDVDVELAEPLYPLPGRTTASIPGLPRSA
jgi:hypothetical protein